MELSKIEHETLLAIYILIKEQWDEGIAIPEPPSVRDISPIVSAKSFSSIKRRIGQLRSKGLVAPRSGKIYGRITRLTNLGLELAEELYNSKEGI